MNQDIYTTQELAELLGCATTTIEDHARRGGLPGLKFGEQGWVFPRLATLEALNAQAREGAALRAGRHPTPVAYVPITDPNVKKFYSPRPPVLWSQA
jgi:excisionase family DNA binding protein